MTRALRAGRRAAVSGRTESVVVFLHGYGADGADLLGLADPLAPHLPDTAFLAPDAPERSVANPFGYQWFPIPWIDGSSEAEAAAGLAAASADLQAWLDQTIAAEGVTADRVALVGFSQGTMMALEIAPRRREELAGVVGFSGRLLRPEMLEAEAMSRPPVLLLHGDADEVVAPSSMPEAADALSAAGFTVMAQHMSGMGHGIAPEGLRLALYFLREQLGYED
jgi:phospholipase/carboxylesterase